MSLSDGARLRGTKDVGGQQSWLPWEVQMGSDFMRIEVEKIFLSGLYHYPDFTRNANR